MKKITDSIEVAIANVQTAFPSIFSKEDVVGILEGLHADSSVEEEKVATKATLSEEEIENLIELISEAVTRKLDRFDAEDIVDFGSAEFSIEYSNTLALDSISVNSDSVSDGVMEVTESVIRSFFETESVSEDEAE